ncbi:hypothetical protein BGZ83_007175, partial [Gryganskiella cystojenkinii]
HGDQEQDHFDQPRKRTYTATSTHHLQEEPERDRNEHESERDPVLDEARRLAIIAAKPWYKRPSLTWLLPFVCLLAIVLGLSQAPQEQLMIKIICKEHLQDADIPAVFPGLQQQSNFSPFDNYNDSSNFANWNRAGDHPDKEKDPCRAADVLAYGALVLSRIRSLKYVTAIFTIGFYTSMSDRYGRKSLVFWTLIPALLTQSLVVYMSRPGVNLGVGILYADALMMGLTGGGLLLEPAMNAYIADCTPAEGRSLSIGLVMTPLSVGIIFGPALGGWLIEWTGQTSSAVVLSVATLIFLTFYALILPESLPKEFRSTRPQKPEVVVVNNKGKNTPLLETIKKNVLEALDPLLLFLPGRIDSRVQETEVLPSKYTLVTLMAAYGLLQFALTGSSTLLIPFTNLVFGWEHLEDGYYYSFIGICSLVVYVVIFPILQKLKKKVASEDQDKRSSDTHTDETLIPPPTVDQITDLHLGNAESPLLAEDAAAESATRGEQDANKIIANVRNDLWFVIFGSIVYSLGYLVVPIFKTEFSLFVTSFIRSLGSVAVPSFVSLVTTVVPTHQTGKALGGICILDTITLSTSSLLFGWVFSKTSVVMPTAIFLLSFAFAFPAILVSGYVWFSYRRLDRKSNP